MKQEHQVFIGLLRGINVGGHNKIPMAELRSLCSELGWTDVVSYIQSGNLVFSASASPETLEAQLQDAIQDRFGFSVTVIVRSAADWRGYINSNPFPQASEKEPNLVMLAVSKAVPAPGAEEGLRERAADGERVVRAGDILWVHFTGGSARSKLSPTLINRLVGSPVTARNWRTVLKLGGLAGIQGDK
jgi:uncharacterized protein (DUF1697 family)